MYYVLSKALNRDPPSKWHKGPRSVRTGKKTLPEKGCSVGWGGDGGVVGGRIKVLAVMKKDNLTVSIRWEKVHIKKKVWHMTKGREPGEERIGRSPSGLRTLKAKPGFQIAAERNKPRSGSAGAGKEMSQFNQSTSKEA